MTKMADKLLGYLLIENVYEHEIDKDDAIKNIYKIDMQNASKDKQYRISGLMTSLLKQVREKYNINLRFIKNKIVYAGDKNIENQDVNSTIMAGRLIRRARGYADEIEKIQKRAPQANINGDINMLKINRDYYVIATNAMKIEVKRKKEPLER